MTTILQATEVADWAKRMHAYRSAERDRLDRIFEYLRDPDVAGANWRFSATGPLRWLNAGVPNDVRRLAEMARVNMLKFVVDATVQVMYVDGFRAKDQADEEPAWETWQLNRMDARQSGVHRAASSYGASYVTVLPGDPVAVLRGVSPRKMTCAYGEDEDWPELALERRNSITPGQKLYRLYDAQRVWYVTRTDRDEWAVEYFEDHGVGHVPVVRFVTSHDDDGVIEGDVEPLIPLQDQINVTTFGLLVAQHYGAFRQRYIMGWAAPSETGALQASAKKLWTFEDPEVKVGEFSQTDLSGYINSREATMRHLATISQTPAHELLGQLVNLSAEALAAAEANHRRKVIERQTSFGESWEQVFELAAKIDGEAIDTTAEVRWRDTEARSLSQVADALGKLVAGLGVPAQELWERIPGVTRQEIERWKLAAEADRAADPMTQLSATLTQQAMGVASGGQSYAPAPTPTPGA